MTKSNLVEVVVALRAAEAGLDRPVAAVPHSLPVGAEPFIPDVAPERNQPSHHPDVDPDSFVDLKGDWKRQIQSSIPDEPWYVYEFVVTPPVGEEHEDITLLRRHTVARKKFGTTAGDLDGIYRAAHHLNNDDSVYYVGIANDVLDRLDQHLRGATHSGSKFTHLFPPTDGVINIRGAGSKEVAEALEEKRAQALTKQNCSWAYFN